MTPHEILPIGSYFDIDPEGFLINPTSLDKIQPQWKPAVDAIVDVYKKEYKDALHSVFVRGSVAKGQAVEYISDIDTIAFIDAPKQDIKKDWKTEARIELKKQFPFIEGFELDPCPLEYLPLETILLNQAVQVYGTPVQVPKLKVGKDMAFHSISPRFRELFASPNILLDKDSTDDEIKKRCTWFMKGLLRVGFEICIERSKRYTRDLYKCYETFAEYYPEKEPEMKRVLFLALNPIGDKNEIEHIINGFGAWLMQEAQIIFPLIPKV